MKEFSSLNGYGVKDAISRDEIRKEAQFRKDEIHLLNGKIDSIKIYKNINEYTVNPGDNIVNILNENETLVINDKYVVDGEAKIKCLIFGENGCLTITNNSLLEVEEIINVDNHKIFEVNNSCLDSYVVRYPLLLNEVYPQWFGAEVVYTVGNEVHELPDAHDYIMHAFRSVSGEWLEPVYDGASKNYSNHCGIVRLDGYYSIKTPINIGGLEGKEGIEAKGLFGSNGTSFIGSGMNNTFLCYSGTETQPVISFNFACSQQKEYSNFVVTACTYDNGVVGYVPYATAGIFFNSCDSIVVKDIWSRGIQPADKSTGSAFVFNSCINTFASNLQVEHSNYGICCYSGETKISGVDMFTVHSYPIKLGWFNDWVEGDNIRTTLLIDNMDLMGCKGTMVLSKVNGYVNINGLHVSGSNGLNTVIENYKTTTLNINGCTCMHNLKKMVVDNADSVTKLNIINSYLEAGDISNTLVYNLGKFYFNVMNTTFKSYGVKVDPGNKLFINYENVIYDNCSSVGGSNFFSVNKTSETVYIKLKDFVLDTAILVNGSPGTIYLSYAPSILANQNIYIDNLINLTTQTLNKTSTTSVKTYDTSYTAVN